jgi:hypothetical protein
MDSTLLATRTVRQISTVNDIYTHLPLKPDMFRLLCLEGVSDTGLLICKLVQVDVNFTDPQYIAVSYTWGGQPRDHALQCSGVEVPVTRSCVDVLSSLLKNIFKSGKGLVWIDQLCVDQENLNERAEQVLLMKKIYAGAEIVVSWLDKLENLTCGLDIHGDEYTPIATPPEDLSSEICESGPDADKSEADETKALVQYLGAYSRTRLAEYRRGKPASLNDMPTSLRAWDHVIAIFSHHYFERRWIIQEIIAKPQHACLLIDHGRMLLWADIQGCAAVLTMVEQGLANEMYPAIPSGVRTKLSTSPDTHRCIPRTFNIRDTKATGDGMTLLELLVECKMFKNTDERDRVFALNGLASDSHLLKPNYHIPIAQLLPAIARYQIMHEKGVTILTNAGLAFRHLDTIVPSWVPTWEAAATVPFNNVVIRRHPDLRQSGLAAAGSSSLNIQLVGDGNTLLAHGSIIDRIHTTSPPYQFKSGESFVTHTRNFVPPNRRPSAAEYRDLIAPFVEHTLNKDRFRRAVGHRLELSLKVMLAPDELLTDQSARPAMQEATQNAFSDLGSHALMTGRRTCVTERGHLGLVPAATEPGDWVGILDGINVAVVAREGQEPDRAKFQLVGDAYFLGLAKGEVLELDIWKTGRRVVAFV